MSGYPEEMATGGATATGQTAPPTVSAVVLAYGDEPWLPRCVRALLASEGVDVDVVLVDNGCLNDDVDELERLPGVTVLRPGRNLGFAEGCDRGAAAGTGAHVALVNSDAVVEPGTLARLVREVASPDVGAAMASIRLSSDPRLINAAGNPVHVLGLSWAGGLGQVEERSEPIEVPVASGACMVMTAPMWRELEGFDPEYFAYHEDTELSMRLWRTGRRVVYIPDAIAVHRYEFSRNKFKYYLIERNRIMFIATLWSWRALLLLSPALLALEIVMLALAAKQRWLGRKLSSYGWLLRHLPHIVARRRRLQSERSVPNRVWMDRLTPLVDTTAIELPFGASVMNWLMRTYWRMIRPLV